MVLDWWQQRRRGAFVLGVAALLGGVLALVAPGSVDAASASAGRSAAVVKPATVTGVGTVLVDAKGRTLYTLTSDGQPIACTGACASAWPPLIASSGARLKTPKGLQRVSVNADRQVAANGLPLYRFAGDAKPGQANGEGIVSFGGIWHVVTVAGPASTGGTARSSSGSGNGSRSNSTGSSYGY